MKNRSGVVLIAPLLLVLAACTTPPSPPPVDEVSSSLESSIARVTNEPAFTSSADGKPPKVAASGPKISIVFHGDAVNLLQRVAAARSLSFKVSGPMPRRDIYVAIDLKNTSFTEFLAEVGGQMGQIADLVYTDSGIEVRYRDHRNVGLLVSQ